MIAARQIAQRQAPMRDRMRKGPRVKTVVRRRYAMFARVALFLSVPFVLVMAYVALTANLTSLGYKSARAGAERDALQAQIARLDERVSQLQSPERLAALAARLGMHDPHSYAVVRLPQEPQPNGARRVAILSTVTDWLKLP